MSKDDDEIDMPTSGGIVRMDRAVQEMVMKLYQGGPGAIAQELYMRDLIVAKLLTKLGVDKIDLHSMNDSPSMNVPLNVSFGISGTDEDEGRIVTVSFKIEKARMN